ncbi:MAG TPA: sugar ABC transporter ATP-binding protein [Solirubrobacterales bacterium]|nr:sugar ABC transporter ATP-binding protein [Solirubrobacterales bacterium]
MAEIEPVLSIRGLRKHFLGTPALRGVDFDVRPGEVHALVGQNGSGKSTLIKVLAGFHQPDEGTVIEFGGERVEISDGAESRRLGLRFVHQDLGLVAELSTVENLALGRGFDTGLGGRIRWRAERREAARRMAELGFYFDVNLPVRELGAAERTGVAIARALWDREEARVLVVDEPTAALPRQEVGLLFEAVRAVQKRGVGVIYVSHRLDEVFELADRVTVLRDGEVVGQRRTAEIDVAGLVDLMVGGEELEAHGEPGMRSSGETRLEVRSLCGTVVDNVDFEVRGGEVLGLAGLTGSGREELLRLVFGALSRSGEVIVDGESVPPGSPGAAIAAGVALVPADRHGLGSITTMTVVENCTLTDLRRHSGIGARLHRGSEHEEVRGWIEDLDIRPADSGAVFATLSGGNQQKVVMAKWLRTRPGVLLLDEPTQGVDVGAKAIIHGLARRAAEEGSAVLIASSDGDELCDVCDRILVIAEGEIVQELTRSELTPASLEQAELGLATAG